MSGAGPGAVAEWSRHSLHLASARAGHTAIVFESLLEWSKKYCSYDHIVGKKVVGKGILCKDIIKYLGFLLE